MKIALFTATSGGQIALDYLSSNKHVEKILVISHDRAEDVARFADFKGDNNGRVEVIMEREAENVADSIRSFSPDLIFVVGWSGLIPKNILGIPTRGAIGFHPSKLPKDRGRSVLAWQIEEGYTETALSLFYFNEIPDGGDIIGQHRIAIETNDYISDVLKKVDLTIYNMLRAYFPLIRMGKQHRAVQNNDLATVRPLRTDHHSVIDWDVNTVNVYNKIRAISRPYPGAMAEVEGKKLRIWRARPVEHDKSDDAISPGTVIEKKNDHIFIKCRDGVLEVEEWDAISD